MILLNIAASTEPGDYCSLKLSVRVLFYVLYSGVREHIPCSVNEPGEPLVLA
jgi:hypothetical protein